MKTLKQYIGNYIEKHINESLFDDENVLSDPKRDKVIIENWIKENYTLTGRLKINKDFVVNCKGSIVVKNKNITSLTNDMFRWGEVDGGFYCCNCGELTSLEGAPKKVGEKFDCTGCHNLKSLIGIPRMVGGKFDCSFCINLTSLEGAPKEVGSDFYCYNCYNLKSLEGAPKKVGGNFSCVSCKNLKSLKGGPKYVKKDFYCSGCPDLVITDSDYKKYNIRP